jgi:hypothetical protein
MALKQGTAIAMAREHFKEFLEQREEAQIADDWIRGDNAKPSKPRETTKEYDELGERAPTPWLGLVVTSVAQSLYVEGHRPKKGRDDSPVWKKLWQPNGMDARQIAVHRGALGHGVSFVKAMEGKQPLTGQSMVQFKGFDAMHMAAFYQDAALDEYPMFTIAAEVEIINGTKGWKVTVTDEEADYNLLCKSADGQEDWSFVDFKRHSAGVPPIVRFANNLDLEGASRSDIAPFIPLASRIDQDTFDRLVVQRFGSWRVRYIAGMAKPANDAEARLQAMALRVEDLLVSPDAATKFGTLDPTDLAGYIAARDADIRDLAAVTQTPPHHLLGLSPNVSAEGLVEAQAGLMRKVDERKHLFGESWERCLRLGAHMSGLPEQAADFESQMLWKDTESRSLAQSADALGKLAQMLQVPVELLWERIPGWTTKDSEDAKAILEKQAQEAMMMAELEAGMADGSAAAGGKGSPPFGQGGPKEPSPTKSSGA